MNGSVNSRIGTRTPSPTGSVLGAYPVTVSAQIRGDGGSTSRQLLAVLEVRPRVMILRQGGVSARIRLADRVRPFKARQRVRGSGNITVRTPGF